MDFYTIKSRVIKDRVSKDEILEIYPDFKVGRSTDLMVRGRSFYAIWDENKGLWSTDEYDVQRLTDREIHKRKLELEEEQDLPVRAKYLSEFSSNAWLQFRSYMNHVSDNAIELDTRLTFSNMEVTKNDYVSKKLSYPLIEGDYSAYDELMSTLYDPEERAKLEWAIGAIISGESTTIQKFIVLYGEAGSGKSTFLNIVERLFEGYTSTFEAKALGTASNAFSTEGFKNNPLVAIQHDGDLSRIDDNTKLNSIIAHENIIINEKNKPQYSMRIRSFLFMGTNRPVRITDAKSGIIRRLIDVSPSGRKVQPSHYEYLMSRIDFELSGIATHCHEVFLSMGRNYYNGVRPTGMIFKTDTFYNFVDNYYDQLLEQEAITLKQAYSMYKEYVSDANVEYPMPMHKFREELKSYYREFHDRIQTESTRARSVYVGFKFEMFGYEDAKPITAEERPASLVLNHTESVLDYVFEDCPAQYANEHETPAKKWSEVTTKLSDLDTTKVHYVKPLPEHIVIDFDLRGEDGEKSAELNLIEAAKWPPTYAEYSKSGSGIHLHYQYTGERIEDLSRLFSEGIEVKVFTGDSSLRRRLTRCNNLPVATLSSGLAFKEEKKVLDAAAVKSEKGLRNLIARNLNKEIHASTKPSVDFIHHILEEAYASGMPYDVSDLQGKIMSFALNSTNQREACLEMVAKMKFKSEYEGVAIPDDEDENYVFFDIEVFPNLVMIGWKFIDADTVQVMTNPSGMEVEEFLSQGYKLIGFNVRKYDNHILYARLLGYNELETYTLSMKIIENSRNAGFVEAYKISYADMYDYFSKKQSLKKFQVELGLHHQELGLPWDKPVPEEKWPLVESYLKNDVITTEQVFKARLADFNARKILAKISGLTVNDTTAKHTARIIFGTDKNYKDSFVYTDLSEMFPGYVYDYGKSTYMGEEVGEGGLVRAKPGMWTNVALLDVASMHPTSIIELNLFGKYTERFKQLLDVRIAIKHKEYDLAKTYFDGQLAPFLKNEEEAEALSYALKIVINIVYGLTSAKFENPFLDIRNVDNIVAKRGALFMIDLMKAVEERGFQVIHIKTDSVKIPEATPEIIEFVMEFGKKYGYTFEYNPEVDLYSKMCLVNDAVYAAKGEKGWTMVGAQFQQPYVKKALFTREPFEFRDYCETKSVSTALYLDLAEGLPEGEHNYHFVGRVGEFVPVLPGTGGGELLREKDGKYHAVIGSKGYLWAESEVVKTLGREDTIDKSYHQVLAQKAADNIAQYGDVEWFLS